MPELYALECSYATCCHDTVKSYRLRLKLRRDNRCLICTRVGNPTPPKAMLKGPPQTDWLRCPECFDRGKPVEWRTAFVTERPDLVFRENQLDSAMAQMFALGAKEEVVPNTAHVIEEHPSIPPGYDARLIMLTKEPLRKAAIYFRWNPEQNEVLTPDKIFQFNFTPDMPAHERVTAMARNLSEEECREIIQTKSMDGMLATYSKIACQHCHRPLPLKAYSRLSLRAAEVGD